MKIKTKCAVLGNIHKYPLQGGSSKIPRGRGFKELTDLKVNKKFLKVTVKQNKFPV